MTLVKAINKKETKLTSPPSYIQLTLKLETQAAIKELEDYFSKSVASLHLRLKDSNHLEYHNNILKFEIPSSLTDLQDVGRFVALNFTPPPDKAFGSIAYNDENKIVVLNTNHRFCDGGFFKFLMSNYTDHIYPKETPHFPRFTSDVFKDQIAKAPDIVPFVNDESVTRIKNIRPNSNINLVSKNQASRDFKYVYHPDGKNYNFTDNVIDDKNSHQMKYLGESEIRIPAREYKSFNPKKNAPEHLTEYLWLSHYFAASAYVGKPFKSFKIRTVNDLRRYLPKPDFLNCYHCAVTAPFVPNISLDDKLSKVGTELREDLLRLRNNDAHFSNLKAVANIGDICQGVDLGITGVGAIKIRRPILDAHCSFLANATKVGDLSTLAGSLYLMSFSGFNKDFPEINNITTKTMHNPNIFPPEVIDTYLRRVRFVLTQVSLDQTIGEVFDQVIKVD